jgi:hypothetical protein
LCTLQHLGVAASNAALAPGRERITAQPVRVGPEQLDGLGAARRRVGQPPIQWISPLVYALQLVPEPTDRVTYQRRRIIPALAEDRLDIRDRRPSDLNLDVVPGWTRTIDGGHRLALRIAVMGDVIAAAVTQVNTADVGNVELWPARMA